LGNESWMLDARYRTLDIGYWILVTANAEREAGCWMLVDGKIG